MNADPRSFIWQGFAVSARLLVRGRADVLVRLATDLEFALVVSQAVYDAFLESVRDDSASESSRNAVLTRLVTEIVRLHEAEDRRDRPS